MGELRIRDVDDDLVALLKIQAKRHGRSLGDEVREVLRAEVRRHRQAIADDLRQFRESLQAKYGVMSDSTVLIREDRDSRG